jgi:hypothetical protein
MVQIGTYIRTPPEQVTQLLGNGMVIEDLGSDNPLVIGYVSLLHFPKSEFKDK